MKTISITGSVLTRPFDLFQNAACIFAKDAQLHERLHWILRISSALCFIGHGAWGLIGKTGWVPFYNVFGISHDTAFATMTLVGVIDICAGIVMLFYPTRALMIYMAVWAVFTAFLRPAAGMGWWEFLERGGNYGAPFALLFLSGTYPKFRDWFKVLPDPVLDEQRTKTLVLYLRVFTAFLMIGHGGYGAFQAKEMLIGHFASVHWPPPEFMSGAQFIRAFGWLEILLGAMVLLKPWKELCLFIVVWKLSTEFLYVVHGPVVWDVFEFIERWGSYGVPLALYFLLAEQKALPQKLNHR